MISFTLHKVHKTKIQKYDKCLRQCKNFLVRKPHKQEATFNGAQLTKLPRHFSKTFLRSANVLPKSAT